MGGEVLKLVSHDVETLVGTLASPELTRLMSVHDCE